jgi:rod shape-determining protein MreB and related proteins
MPARLNVLLPQSIAVDLGTSNSRIFIKGQGIALREPSVVATHKNTGHIVSVGKEAELLIGREPPNIVTAHPVKSGAIAHFNLAKEMLHRFIAKAFQGQSCARFRTIACVPSGVTVLEERALRDAILETGAREVFMVKAPIAAAIGAGITVGEAAGHMIVSIGGGTSEIAVISLRRTVEGAFLRFGGNVIDQAIASHVRTGYNLMIGDRTAEMIKISIGTNQYQNCHSEMEVRGRDIVTGLPRTVNIRSEKITEAFSETVSLVLTSIRETLSRIPPEIAADIMEKGILLTGGSSMLYGLSHRISKETGITVVLAETPMDSAILGAGNLLSEKNNML